MKRRKIGRIALLSTIGLISYSGFLIANMPAEKLWQYLPTDQLPVQLAGINGTPWKGSAESITLALSRTPLVLPSIRWQIDTGSLLQGDLKVAIELGGAASPIEGEGIVTLDQQTLTLENLALDTTAQWLLSSIRAATGGKVPGELTGNVFLQLDELVMNNSGCTQLKGDAEWTGSRLSSPFGQFDLGSSTAELSCKNKNLVAKVSQKSPIISSYGDFQIGTSGRYTFTGKMTPDSSLSDTMKQGFSLLGRADSNGAYPLSFRGIVK